MDTGRRPGRASAGRYAELEARYVEASEYGRLQRRYQELERMYARLTAPVMALHRDGLLDRSRLPDDLAHFADETSDDSHASITA